MTAISDDTAFWQLDEESLYRVLSQGEAERRRIYLRSLEVIAELLSRTAEDKDAIATVCANVCHSMGISRREAMRMIERMRVLRREKVHEAAHGQGLSPEHLAAIDTTLNDAPPADRDRVEEAMLAEAANVDSTGMRAIGHHILQLLDQDGKPPNDRDLAEPRREFHYTTRIDGTFAFRGQIDAESGALLASMISPLTKPTSAKDPRDLAQRQGDALVDVIELAAGHKKAPTEAGERPHVGITISLEALQGQLAKLRKELPEHAGLAQLARGGHTDIGSARRIACDCKVLPMVLGSKSDPLDFGRLERIVPHRLRRALIHRDKGCAFPRCQRDARQCQAHHVEHWIDGGLTTLDNTVLLCGHHHRLIHHSDWAVSMENKRPKFTAPRAVPAALPPTS